MDKLMSMFRKKHAPPTVLIRDYIDMCREIDFLKHDIEILRSEIYKIRQTDEAKIREQVNKMRDDAYDLFKNLERILEVEDATTR